MTTIAELKIALAPILLKCVKDKQRITYGEAANEAVRLKLVNSAHHRQVGPAVGALMDDLLEIHGNKIPPLNCLVVNGGTGVASGGAGYYVAQYVGTEDEYENLTVEGKLQLLENHIWPDVYKFHWSKILVPYFEENRA